MAKAALHLWTQCYKKGTPLIKNTTSQKWHLNKNSANRTYPLDTGE